MGFDFSHNGRPLLYSILIHVGLMVLLGVSLDWSSKPQPPSRQSVDIVQAQFVDESKVKAELKRRDDAVKARAEAKRRAEEKRRAEIKRKADAAAKQKADAERKAEAARKAEIKRKADAAAKREAEAKRKADAAAKREAEAKRKADAEVKRKADAAAEQRRRAEADRKQREAELKAQIAAEQEAERRAAADRAAERTVLSFTAQIQHKVQRYWLKPPAWRAGVECTIEVQMIPGGEVVSVRLLKSCGSGVFDRSVENAVRKASPLPVPSDPSIFDRMRVIRFNFRPE